VNAGMRGTPAAMLECRRPIVDATQAICPDSVTANQLQALVINTLDEVKAQDVRVFDVTDKTSVTDHMVVASGTSSRHVKTIADHLVTAAKQAGFRPLGVEGAGDSDWVLVDLADVVVHVMLPQARSFYNLEKLWAVDAEPVSTGVAP
jgi:ribosome-associated protein